MAEIETRELEYFVAVAEELHFGRAAERLSIAQPALSKTIRRLEARLGTQLLERTSRRVVLTPAGTALRDQGRAALEAVSLAVERTRRAAAPEASLRLVLKPGGDAELLPAILAEYATRPGARHVEVLFGSIAERGTWLREGRADAAFLFTALDDLTGLSYRPLLTLERVAVVSHDHPLAAEPAVRMSDLDGETLPRWRGLGGPGGGPEVDDVAQLGHLISAGRCIAILPRTAIGPAGPDVVSVPILDAEPTTIVLAWPEGSAPGPLAELVDAAETAASRRLHAEVAGASTSSLAQTTP